MCHTHYLQPLLPHASCEVWYEPTAYCSGWASAIAAAIYAEGTPTSRTLQHYVCFQDTMCGARYCSYMVYEHVPTGGTPATCPSVDQRSTRYRYPRSMY